jgi:hypothetical protein
MKFRDYLKNRDPQLAQGLTEGIFGPTLSPEQKQTYQQYKNDIDALIQNYRQAGQRVALPAAIDEFVKTNGMRLANMKRDQGLRPPNDYRAAPNLGREGPVTPFRGMAQRHGGTLPGQ